jgi:hypothetical protein
MLKKLLCGLTILTTAYGAEYQRCYFALIPLEVHTLIASFLSFDDRETEVEFVERTRIVEDVPIMVYHPYLQGVWQQVNNLEFQPVQHVRADSTLTRYCPNERKFILFEWFTCPPKFLITIVDKHKKRILHAEQLKKHAYAIALSRNAHMFATRQDTSDLYQTMLVVKDIASQNTQLFTIYECTCHEPTNIAFNKQSTQIIAHHKRHGIPSIRGNKCIVSDAEPYTIFQLASPEEIKLKEQKTLSSYFENKLVCKKFKN